MGTPRKPTLKQVISFLCGDKPLNGHWFGDPPPVVNGRPRPFWWRSVLRDAYRRDRKTPHAIKWDVAT